MTDMLKCVLKDPSSSVCSVSFPKKF